MREPLMYEPMTKLLESEGYTILSMAKGRQHGADIVAERESRKLIMEMKGDSAALDVDLGTGIFQVFRRMRDEPDQEYALGVSGAYIKLVQQVDYPLKKLGIRVFVIDENPRQLW